MDKAAALEEIREKAEDFAREGGFELVHVEIKGSGKQRFLRVFIDKPEGVTHDDCAKLSAKLDEFLDEGDIMKSGFVLEVSSPGIERGLYKVQDYKRFAGSRIKLRTNAPIDKKRNFLGKLVGVENEEVVLSEDNGKVYKFDINDISKANLKVDLEEEMKKAKTRR
ncbi:MAG: ribosome maturation factor RimP [Pyrinomonadaceae bacterium]